MIDSGAEKSYMHTIHNLPVHYVYIASEYFYTSSKQDVYLRCTHVICKMTDAANLTQFSEV